MNYPQGATTEDKKRVGLMGWDLGRMAYLARESYSCGFINYDEAMEILMFCAVDAKKYLGHGMSIPRIMQQADAIGEETKRQIK